MWVSGIGMGIQYTVHRHEAMNEWREWEISVHDGEYGKI